MMQTIAEDARFWDKLAKKYAASAIKDMAGYERSVARTRELIGISASVLEIGCGTGTTALKLAPNVAHLTATDVSGEMIAIARNKAETEACRNVTFAVAAAGSAPGSDGSYDAAIAFNLLHLVADRRSIFADLYRLLKPGGLFISKTPCLSEMTRLIRYAIPVARLIGMAPSHVSSFTAADLADEINSAGFSVVECARHGSKKNEARIFIVAEKPVAN